jgi:hypothetical protein
MKYLKIQSSKKNKSLGIVMFHEKTKPEARQYNDLLFGPVNGDECTYYFFNELEL